MNPVQKVVHFKKQIHNRNKALENAKSSTNKEDYERHISSSNRNEAYIQTNKKEAEKLERKLMKKLHHAGIPKIQIDYDFTN